jgi:ABC-type transport system involved in multi-copper enzyme maturation permease subunit
VNRILAIALNTFRETIRARVIYVLLLAGLLTIGSATLLSPLALGETTRITKDVGLTAIELLGLLIITLLGTTVVYKEIEKRTVVLLLSKPIRRHEFILGKFLGLSLTLALVVVVETVFVELALLLAGGGFDVRLLAGVGMGLAALTTINAIAMLYASFAGPILAAFLTGATYVAGRLGTDLFAFAAGHDIPVVGYVFYLLPNLSSMDLRSEVVHGFAFDPAHIGLALAHGLSYAAGALILAVVAFRHREFR